MFARPPTALPSRKLVPSLQSPIPRPPTQCKSPSQLTQPKGEGVRMNATRNPCAATTGAATTGGVTTDPVTVVTPLRSGPYHAKVWLLGTCGC